MARFEKGWFKMYRQAVEGDIGQNPLRLALFVRLLSWATRRETRVTMNGKPVTIPAGSVITSTRQISERTRIDKNTALRHLKYLEKRDTIRRIPGAEGTLITFCNWDKYSGEHSGPGHLCIHERDTDGTPTGHGRDRTAPPIGEGRKEERENGRNTGIPDAIRKEWNATCHHYGASTKIEHEIVIYRVYQRVQNWDRVKNAIIGMRFDHPNPGYNPQQHFTIHQLTVPQKFDRLENLGEMKPGPPRERGMKSVIDEVDLT